MEAVPAAPASRLNAERQVLGLVVGHPWLFDEIEERLGSMQCSDAGLEDGLDALRQALAVIGRSRLRDELKHTRATDATAEDWAARLSLIEASLGSGDE